MGIGQTLTNRIRFLMTTTVIPFVTYFGLNYYTTYNKYSKLVLSFIHYINKLMTFWFYFAHRLFQQLG